MTEMNTMGEKPREFPKRPRPPLLVAVSTVEWIASTIGGRPVTFIAMESDIRALDVLAHLLFLKSAGEVGEKSCAQMVYKDPEALRTAIDMRHCVPEACVPIVTHEVRGSFTLGGSICGKKVLRRAYPSSWLYDPKFEKLSWHQVVLVSPTSRAPLENIAKQLAAWLKAGLVHTPS